MTIKKEEDFARVMMKKKERTPTDVQNITPKKKIDGQLKFVFYSIEDLSEVAGIDDN